jgi:serine/threonine protein kinase
MAGILDNYERIKKLGNQKNRKFGEVYLAQNRANLEFCVLKTCVKTPDNSLVQAQLRKEAEFSFQHPSLPETLDFLEDDEKITLVKSYLKGETLGVFWKKIPSRKRAASLLSILSKIIPTLEFLHENKIVHCDLKPSNILVEQIGEEFHVSLIDFGMSLNMAKENKRSTLFPLGYAAPELLMNRLDLVDHRTDQFALGIIIWKMFAGKLPLTHPNPSVFTNLQLTHPLPNHSDLPKGWYEILQKMCYKESFRTAPNLLSQEEVTTVLKNGMAGRYPNLESCLFEFEKLPQRKKTGLINRILFGNRS